MTGRTHIAAGLLVASAATAFTGDLLSIGMFTAGCAYGSLVPDIDADYSLGKSYFLISTALFQLVKRIFRGTRFSKLFDHRWILHSLSIPAIILLLSLFMPVPWKNLCIGIFSGWMSHLILDYLNGGIRLMLPLSNRKFSFPIRFRNGGIFDISSRIVFTISYLLLFAVFSWKPVIPLPY